MDQSNFHLKIYDFILRFTGIFYEAMTQHLSITTFRYVPRDLQVRQTPETEPYLERLNRELLTRIERSGEAFLSNAMIGDRFALRACIVNFRTSRADIDMLPPLLARLGRETDDAMRRAAV